MSIKSINIELREQVEHTLTRQMPVVAGAELYRATGETESRAWSGPWEQMREKFEGLEYSYFRRLNATLKRVADGEFGELTATWTFYEAGDGSGEAGSDVQPGTDREHPEYDYVQYMLNKSILMAVHNNDIKGQRTVATENADKIPFYSFSELWKL